MGVGTFMDVFSRLFHACSKWQRAGEIKACHQVDSKMREETTGCEGKTGWGGLRVPVKARLGVFRELEKVALT